MADYDRRGGGGGGGYHNSRKRRYRDDDDSYDRRGPRRRHEPPVPVRIRKQILELAESPLRRGHEEIQAIAQLLADNYDDERLRSNFVELVLQLVVEQPLKTPFVAAVVLVVNTLTYSGTEVAQPTSGVVDDLLAKLAAAIGDKIRLGEWRGVKLYLKFLACLQSCLEGEGVFPILDDLMTRAFDLQTKSSEDTIGTELVKIILLTLPYAMSAAPGMWDKQAADLLDKTDIIASDPHALQTLIDPYHPEGDEPSPAAEMSFIKLLQAQLLAEAGSGWRVACLPRPWTMPLEEVEQQEKLDNCPTHKLPAINFPEVLISGPRPLFPEIYFSVYDNQGVESVPPVTSLAASLVRDSLLDTINILDFNRTVTARLLIDVDCYFADGTFIKRATPFDHLRDVAPGRSTWKPEDVAVDAVFSQLFQLPNPEHKLVYYHSVLTEACRIAPAAIAPSLGRAIRYLYRNSNQIDLELGHRFIDWFAHHLSNFGFTWKWVEWTEDVSLSNLDPCKAFIVGAIDKEIRLSFAQRIKKTLPPEYEVLIGPEQEQDVPTFKFKNDATPFAAEGREIATLLKRKAEDQEIQPVIERIHSLAIDQSIDPLVASTDVFTTAMLAIGSKSLSHVLAAIERSRNRLADAAFASEPAKSQIIFAVMTYWGSHPGVAISIVEKLLNYSIITPAAVIQWALVTYAGATKGEALAQAHIYEMVFNTVMKVTGRVRQVVVNPSQPAPDQDVDMTGNGPEETKQREIKNMRDLFRLMEDSLVAWASGSKDEMMEDGNADAEAKEKRDRLVRRWGDRWLRAFKRRAAIEEAFLIEAAKAPPPAPAQAEALQAENGDGIE